jgi:hypothetical protein
LIGACAVLVRPAQPDRQAGSRLGVGKGVEQHGTGRQVVAGCRRLSDLLRVNTVARAPGAERSK